MGIKGPAFVAQMTMKNYMRIIRTIVVVIALTLCISFFGVSKPVYAMDHLDSNWGASDENTPVDVSYATQTPTKIFSIDDKTYIIWTRSATIYTQDKYEIRLQRFTIDGRKELGNDGVLLAADTNNQSPTKFLVYQDKFILLAFDYAQAFNLDGHPLWDGRGFQLEGDVNSLIDTQIFSIDTSSFGILWVRDQYSTHYRDVRYQRLDFSGRSLLQNGTTVDLETDIREGGIYNPRVAVKGNYFFVAKIDPWLLLVNKYDLTGIQQWSTPVTIADRSGGMDLSRLYFFSDDFDGLQIFWNDTRGVVGERIDLNGNRLWSARDGIVFSTAANSILNVPVYLAGNTFLPIFNNVANNLNLGMQKIDLLGHNIWGKENLLFQYTQAFGGSQVFCENASEDSLICPTSTPTGNSDIVIQGINTSGQLLFTPSQVVSNAFSAQGAPIVSVDSKFGAVLTWTDYRSNQDYDVYAQRIRLDTTAPSSSYSTNPSTPDGKDGYYKTVPTITLTAADQEVSGVKNILYNWDNAAYQVYSTPLLAPEGTHTLYYYADDNAGNVEVVHSVLVQVDTSTPPSPPAPPPPVVTPEVPSVTPTPVVVPVLPLLITEPTPVVTPGKVLGVTTTRPILKTLKLTKGVYSYKLNGKKITFRPFGTNYKGTVWARSVDFGPDGKIYVFINSGAYSKGQIRVYRADGKLLKAYNPYGGFATNGLNATAVVEYDDNVYLSVGTAKAGTTVKSYQVTAQGLQTLKSVTVTKTRGNVLVGFRKLYKNQYGLVTMRQNSRSTLKVWKLDLTTNKFVEDKKIKKSKIKI